MSAASRVGGELEAGLRLLQQGDGAAAREVLGSAEAAGSRDASLVLAQAFLLGAPLAPDPAAAVRHLERAAREPWGPPEQLLAALHRIGYGIAPDGPQAWRWLRQALGAGHAAALRSAGIQRAVRGDAEGARRCLEAAAAKGDAFAVHSLALLAAVAGDLADARRRFTASPLPVSKRRLQQVVALDWPLDGARWTPEQDLPPWHDAPRRGAVRALMESPRIEVQDAGLSPWECDYLMTVCAPDLRPSRTVDPLGTSVHADPARTSADASLRGLFPDLVVHDAALAMAALAGLPLERSEALGMLRYGVGQEYREHYDHLPPATLEAPRWRDQGQRVATVIAYLDAVPAGGATSFPRLALSVAPQAGRLLRFDNVLPDGSGDTRTLHRGEPVTAGDKWIVTAWFRERAATGFVGGQIPGRVA